MTLVHYKYLVIHESYPEPIECRSKKDALGLVELLLPNAKDVIIRTVEIV